MIMTTNEHKFTPKIFRILFLFFLLSISLFANDDYFQFLDQYLPEKIEYEKARKLCLFPFRNTAENEKIQYLSNGIPSVIISNLNGFKFVYDTQVMENVVYHEFGNPNNANKAPKNKKQVVNRKTLDSLNAGEKESLPEQDPRYIKLDVELVQMETAPLLESNLEIGRKNKCFYIITGDYKQTGDDTLNINVEFTYRKNGVVEKTSETTSLKRSYQEMSSFGMKIKKLLFNKEMATIQVETGEEKDALVFIDGHYAGKTPLEKADVASGRHSISITKEGFEKINKVLNLKKDTVSKYEFDLKKIEKKGLISVTSNPEGASVYLGITYLGETPLKDIVVPLGQNRIRIEKEEFIDYYAGIEIESGKPYTVNAKLKQGNTEEYYKNRLKVFLDYTYLDFAEYSLFSVIIFYANYQYWNYRVNVHKDSIRGDNPWQGEVVSDILLFSTYQNYFTGSDASSINNFLVFYNYQNILVRRNERISNEFRMYRDISGYSAISMLVLSGVFYYLGVDNDAFEFAFTPIIPTTTNITVGTPTIESYIKFNFRF